MAGKIIADTLETGAGADIATSYVVNGSAKAWANINGGGTPSIRNSLNSASITDNATGDFTINFTSSMDDADYVTENDAEASSDTNTHHNYNMTVNLYGTKTNYIISSSYRLKVSGGVSQHGLTDSAQIHTAVHGDLA